MNVIWHQGGNLRGAEHNPTNYFVILRLVQINCGQLTTNPGIEAQRQRYRGIGVKTHEGIERHIRVSQAVLRGALAPLLPNAASYGASNPVNAAQA